jgi:uncharacterized protein YmfQ (DUF2313 family)
MTTTRDLLTLLLPPVSYNPNGERLRVELQAEANAIDAVKANATLIENAITPFNAGVFLSDWERVVGITQIGDKTYQERVSQVLAKLAETGGLSRSYFIQLAASLGYTITIDEPQPFRAGINRAGDTIYIEEIIFCWLVNVLSSSVNVYQFRAGRSAASERLLSFGDNRLESLLNELKPAHTFVSFAYLEDHNND